MSAGTCTIVTAPRWRAPLLSVALVVGVALTGCGASAERPGATPGPPSTITVAAASDVRFAFEELAERFTGDTGIEVVFSFGSSGQLREQIVNGAPFDLFASANVAFVDAVIDAGRGVAATRTDYALGRLALWAAPGRPLPGSVEELADPAYRRIALANPDHAPYGLAGVQALASAGIDDVVGGRLVYGENVSDTFRLARSGSAEVGIVALSLVVADGGPHTLVPEELHEPLRQALVVTGSGSRGEAATAFAELVDSPAGREVMVRHGFVLPGEQLAER